MAAYFGPWKTVLHNNIGALNAPKVRQHEHGKIFVNEAQRKLLKEVISSSKISLHLETENLLLPKPALSAFCQQQSSGFPFPINMSCDLIAAKVKPWQGLKANRKKWGSRAEQRGACYTAMANSGRMLQLKHEPPNRRWKRVFLRAWVMLGLPIFQWRRKADCHPRIRNFWSGIRMALWFVKCLIAILQGCSLKDTGNQFNNHAYHYIHQIAPVHI